MPDELTGTALRARAGDSAAAAEFVRASQADVWRLCAHLASRDYADDLTQETYLRAFRGLPGFAGRSSARTWLLAIARRVVVDHFRAKASRPPGPPPPDASHPDPQHAVPGVDEAVTLRALVRTLEPDRREAFVLTQVLGLSYAEASQLCECPVGTIRSRVARARDDLLRATRAADAAGQDRHRALPR